MKLSKKGKKGIRIKKLANGGNGNGDPVKEIPDTPVLAQDYDQFPLYRETLKDGSTRITPTPLTGNYVKIEERGYYPGIPFLLDEAVVTPEDSNRYSLESIEKVVERTGSGVLGDYAKIPESVRKDYEQGVTEALNEGSIIAGLALSPLIAVGGSQILGLGLEAYSSIAPTSLLSIEGETALTLGQGVDILGAGVAAEYAPEHVKNFIEDPSLANAAFIGLDLLGLFAGGSAAKQTYTQTLRATSGLQNPMRFTSATNLGTEAIIANEVNQATNFFNNTVKNELSSIDRLGISPQQKQKLIDEVLTFYNQYLDNPEALATLQSHKRFINEAKTGMFSSGVPMSPVIADDMATQAYIYTRSKPYYASHNTAGETNLYTRKPVRNLSVVDDGTGTPDVKVNYFSDTSQGRASAAEALIENYRSGSQSVRNAIETTVDDMRRQFGTSARGVSTAVEDITGQVEMIDGIPVTSGNFGYDLSAQQIKFLNEGSYEQILNTLVHETNHNMLAPFLNQSADMQIVEMHLIGATNRVAAFPGQRPGRSLVEGFHKIDDMIPEVQRIGQKYAALDPNLNAAGVEDYVMELLLPDETLARLFEIKQVYSQIAAKQGIKNNEWMYNFNPETARQALQAWKGTKDSPIEADIFLDIMQGSDTSNKLRTLSSLLNETFTPMPVAVAGSAVATQAIISDEETPTINKRGGFISRKKRRKGYRSI